ncbi:MAG: redoxin domain-containing protein [Bdellovibrionota bacterium]
MNTRHFSVALACTASMLLAPLAMAQDSAQPKIEVAIGKQVPDFTLKGSDGKEHTLSSHWKTDKQPGQYVVLEWFNNECPFVDKHYATGNMQRLQKKFTEDGAAWYTVASSQEGSQGYIADKEAAQKIMEKRGIKDSIILLDAEGVAFEAFKAITTPHMFLISPEGKLLYHGAIDDKRQFNHDSVKGAKNFVEAAYQEAKEGKTVSTPYERQYGCTIKQDPKKTKTQASLTEATAPLL